MPVTVQIEPFARCQAELIPLFEKANDEFGQFHDVAPLAPDFERYQALDAAGVLFLTTLRRDGKLVGYMTTSVTMGMHYRTTRIAVMDIAYIDLSVRGRGYIFMLIDHVEVSLRNLGVDIWLCHYVSDNSAGFQRVLNQCGFVPTEQHMGKILR